MRLSAKNDDLNNIVKDLHNKLNVKEENLGFTKNQVDDANRNIAMLQVIVFINITNYIIRIK